MIEQDVVEYIEGELARRGIYYMNVLGGVKTTRTGQSDIVACLDGRFVAIECKLSTTVSTAQFRRGMEILSSKGRFIVANKDIDIDNLLASNLETVAINPLSDAEAIPTPKKTVEYVADYSILPLKVDSSTLTYGERVAKEKYEEQQLKARQKSVATALEDRTEMSAKPVYYPELPADRVYVDWKDKFTESASIYASSLVKSDKFALLTANTGMGKTSAVVATAGKLAEEDKCDIKVCIIAPTKSIERKGWVKHINEWNATHKYQIIIVWHTSPRGFTLATKEKKNTDFIKKELGKKGLLIIDEVQDFKNPTSKGSRALAKLKTLRKVALTATDVTNDKLKDIASYLIIAGYYSSFNDFMNKENLKDLRNKNNKFLVYDDKGEIDVSKWPEWSSVEEKWRHIHVKYELPDRLSYPNIATETILLKEDTQLEEDVKSVLTAQRLRSFDTPKQAYLAISDRVYTDQQRLDTILQLIQEDGVVQPLIFYFHNSVKQIIQEHFIELGIEWQEVSGETKSSSFDEKNPAPVFVQYKSGGASIEFLDSNLTVFAENQPSVAMHNQAQGRNVRRGMSGLVRHYIIQSNTEFDSHMLEVRGQKQDVAKRDFEKNFLEHLYE